nr:ABC transporter ATP-binding protein [Pseudohoeflea sp. DP4N28-3]
MRFGRFVALEDVSLSVAPGEFVTLLGPSGCGKTTLLKIISGFTVPTSGHIEIGGEDVTQVPPEKRDTALCFQSYALFPHLSVNDNLEFGLLNKGMARGERGQRIDEVAAQLALELQLAKLPNQLSGGQQQRVSLGRALAMRPKVLLFDEPLSNLDAKLRDQVRIEIRRIQKSHALTAIYVTHDQAEALAMSDRVVVMNAGRVEQVATPEELYHAPRTSFVADFIGNANVIDAAVLGEDKPGLWRLQTELGQLQARSAAPPRAKEIRICWRPEAAELDGTEAQSIEARLTHRSFQGHYTDLFLDKEGCEFRILVPQVHADVGDLLRFTLAPEKIVLLEPVA